MTVETALALALDAASQDPQPDDLRLADRVTITQRHD
jgi:hypothetical protein